MSTGFLIIVMYVDLLVSPIKSLICPYLNLKIIVTIVGSVVFINWGLFYHPRPYIDLFVILRIPKYLLGFGTHTKYLECKQNML